MDEYKKTNKNNYKNRRLKVKKNIVICFSAVGVFGILVANLYGYSEVSKLKYDIHYLKQDLRKKEVLLEQLNVKVNDKTSIEEIEKKAKEELNLDYPKKEQIQYIEIED